MSACAIHKMTLGDTEPPILFTLGAQEKPDPVVPTDLTLADTVTLHLRIEDLSLPSQEHVMTVVSPATAGKVTYQHTGPDFPSVGDYVGRIEVVWLTGQRRSWQPVIVRVEEALGE